MAPNGDITLFGKNIVFNSPGGVNLNGKVNIDITDPQKIILPQGIAPLAVTAIAELVAKDEMGEEAQSPVDFTLDLEDFYGNELSVHFEDIKGRPWSFVSDMGDERTGIVDARLVQLQGVHIQKDFQFSIKGVTINVGEG
jgi:hypothetical protein